MRFHGLLKNLLRFSVVLLIAGHIISCSDDDAVKPPALKTLEDSVRQKVWYTMDTMIKARGIPGAIVMIEKAGYEPCYISVGYRDDQKDTMKTNTRFLVGSISKTFVAEVILQYVKLGKIGLDDKLTKYLDAITIPGIENVTIRQLLNHTSGMGEYLTDSFIPWAIAHKGSSISRAALTDTLNTKKLLFEPGKEVHYSNAAYITLGLLAEKIGGKPVEQLVKELYINPMGFQNTNFPSSLTETNTWLSNEAHGYGYGLTGELVDYTSFDPSYTWSAGAVVSNAYDLREHLKELLTGDKMLNTSLQAERLKFNSTTLPSYGTVSFGLAVAQIGEKYRGHSGGWLGYNSNIYYRMDKNTYFITFVNKYSGGENPAWDLMIYVNEVLFPGEPAQIVRFDESRAFGTRYFESRHSTK